MLGRGLCNVLQYSLGTGVAISTIFCRGQSHFRLNCGQMAALLKLNLHLSSTPATAAAEYLITCFNRFY